MSLTFYFAPQSTASITTLVFEELGTPCERVQLDLRKGDTKKPEFRKINPNGHTQWAPEDERNAKAAATASADIAAQLGILDEALAGKSFLLGEYTLADAHVGSFVDWLRHMKIDMTAFKHLNAWSQRCAERPAYKRVMAREHG
jgi:glutathione S-transferase